MHVSASNSIVHRTIKSRLFALNVREGRVARIIRRFTPHVLRIYSIEGQ
jgi:hypothetical protein